MIVILDAYKSFLEWQVLQPFVWKIACKYFRCDGMNWCMVFNHVGGALSYLIVLNLHLVKFN